MSKDDLAKAVKAAEEAISQGRRIKAEREAEAQRKYLRLQEYEKDKHDEKLRLSEGIFGWGKEFLESREYRDIAKLIRQDPFAFPGHRPDKLWIYNGGWGHEPGKEESYGCWSRFYLLSEGAFEYSAGYKWMGFIGPEIVFQRPSSLASRLSHTYIERLHDFLISGKVNEYLAKNITKFAG